jgi:hypothetical protein
MSPEVEAAIIAGCFGVLTLIGPVIAQIIGFRLRDGRRGGGRLHSLGARLRVSSGWLPGTCCQVRAPR